MILRLPKPTDNDFYYSCVAPVEQRKYCRNTNPISYADHTAWFAHSLNNIHRTMYLGLVAEKPVGHIFFDRTDDEAEISIFIHPELHNIDYGKTLLHRGIMRFNHEHPAIEYLIANIHTDNMASLYIFQREGFIQHGIDPKDHRFKQYRLKGGGRWECLIDS